ncbi:MAG TPA: ATP-binding protein, partial [Armatimonadota bacterium]|nr:ATP-binding protein [Armatimonadota bacterium]
LPRLFEPLFTTKEGGTGLGLFSCRRIIEDEHNGAIEVDTRAGEGTTITVRLLTADATATDPAGPSTDVNIEA